MFVEETIPPRPDIGNTAGPPRPPSFGAYRQAMLSLFWFSTSAHWSAILLILLPLQAKAIGGAAFKGRTLAAILLGGALVAMVVAPLFGAWSDRTPTRWGRRKPFLVVGTVGNVIGLLALAFIPATPAALVPYIVAFLGIELFNNLATAPYSALIPDVAPPDRRGSASGWMGLMMILGSFVGGMTGLVLPWIGGVTGAYLILSALLLLGMMGTVLSVQEPPAPAVRPFCWGAFLRGLVEPFRSRDFTWVFLTRLLVMLGTFTVQEFVQYYLGDVVGGGAEQHSYTFFGMPLADAADAAASYFFMALLLGAIPGTLAAGVLSDRYGRKLMVYLSGGLQGAVLIVLIFSGSFEVAVLTGLVFGLGYGAYQAVDWALASDVLPSQDDYAKDMGVWHVAFTLPQVVATPIAGVLLDLFQKEGAGVGLPNLGYSVIFGLAFVYFLLGTALVRQVKGAR